MCEYASIIDQAKDMAGLDFASLSDNFTREVLVGAFDFKPAFKEIKSLQKQATDCIDAKKLYSKLQEADLQEEGEDQWDAFGDDNQGDEWNVFRTLTDMKALENEAMNCVDKPDRFTIGEIGGKLFASMFDNAL